MGQFAVMRQQPSGMSAWLIYNDANLRVTQAGWDNPSPFGVRLWIFDGTTLIHETLLSAGGAGTQNVPGNYRLRELTDEFGPFLALPVGISYRMQWPG